MTIKIYKDFSQGGFLMAPYIFIKTLQPTCTLVLSAIISEFNYAHNNRLNYNNDFLCNAKRMSEYLRLDEEDLSTAINRLQKLNFINIFNANIEDTLYIRVFQDEIIKYKLKQEKINFFGKWDDGLKRCQNPIHKKTTFLDSTNKIKEFLEEHTNYYEKIPMVMYSYLDDVVREYETTKGESIFTISDIKDYMFKMAQEKDYDIYLFEAFMNTINKLSKT